MLSLAYIRCNGGDYFLGELGSCPLDGWFSDESKELARVLKRFKEQAQEVSMATLREAGLSGKVLQRVIVIQFASDVSAFELIAPKGYIVDGRWRPIEALGLGFK
jgi:hypothetical protein